MARKPNPFPIPTLRTRGEAFQLRWFFQKKRYETSIGRMTAGEAKKLLAATAAALAERNEWPEEIINDSTVKRYIAEKNSLDPNIDGSTLIQKYVEHMRANNQSTWPGKVRTYLKKTQEAVGGNIQSASAEQIHEYLDRVAETHKPTRNRMTAALSGFFRWLRITGHHPKSYNPMENIGRIREERKINGITIWEKNEIPSLLKAADEIKHGIAIWLAVYAGLPRDEDRIIAIAKTLGVDINWLFGYKP